MPGVPLHGALGICKYHWKCDVMESHFQSLRVMPQVVGDSGVGMAGETLQKPAREVTLTKPLSTAARSGDFLALL